MRAFVIGNVALDEAVTVADLPAFGASIHGKAGQIDLGGKGANQAIMLARSGLPCCFCAAVGEDSRADEIRSRLVAEPLETDLVRIAGVASDFSIILRNPSGDNAIITTNAAASGLTPEAACASLAGAVPGDLLVLQGNLSTETTAAALRKAWEMGMQTTVNPSPLRPFFGDLWPLVDIAFVNECEAATLGGTDTLLAAGVPQVVLTLGSKGARLVTPTGDVLVLAQPCEAVDTTGAGDCFMATALASAALRGVALDPRALRHAAAAAAITVSRPGTGAAFPTKAELAEILKQP
ncbi:MAG: ribokinase [Tabrizicola sp.]|uniref:ribokinase n=1 Tax=Tabrizicola sp. TaxID=2005166 RepID=UPI003BB2218E